MTEHLRIRDAFAARLANLIAKATPVARISVTGGTLLIRMNSTLAFTVVVSIARKSTVAYHSRIEKKEENHVVSPQ